MTTKSSSRGGRREGAGRKRAEERPITIGFRIEAGLLELANRARAKMTTERGRPLSLGEFLRRSVELALSQQYLLLPASPPGEPTASSFQVRPEFKARIDQAIAADFAASVADLLRAGIIQVANAAGEGLPAPSKEPQS